ncbi:MAG: zinc ribbon domain-containing protein [Chloroflexota bacterium]
MSRESLGYVKLEWTCPKCGSRNPGPEKTCLSCGAPQPENVQFEQAQTQELIQDQAELAKAKAGADIHCAFCGARNPAGATTCSQCGADLKEGAKRQAGRVVGAFSTGPVKQVACPRCGTMNPETALKCAQCGAPTGVAPAPSKVSQPARSAKPSMLGIGLVAAFGALCLIAIVVFVVLSLRTEGQNGVVQGVHWTTSVIVEARLPAEHQDWVDEIPADAQVGNCTQKVYKVQDEPAPNANKVCGTSYTVDKGSGYAEVVQDCRYEIMKDYCTYTVLEWQTFDTVQMEGTDYTPVWAEPQLTGEQRLGTRSQEFEVSFGTDEGQYTYTTTDLNQFTEFQVGSEWILNINTFGSVVSVEPVQ